MGSARERHREQLGGARDVEDPLDAGWPGRDAEIDAPGPRVLPGLEEDVEARGVHERKGAEVEYQPGEAGLEVLAHQRGEHVRGLHVQLALGREPQLVAVRASAAPEGTPAAA